MSEKMPIYEEEETQKLNKMPPSCSDDEIRVTEEGLLEEHSGDQL